VVPTRNVAAAAVRRDRGFGRAGTPVVDRGPEARVEVGRYGVAASAASVWSSPAPVASPPQA
jgi:hypothetical protein